MLAKVRILWLASMVVLATVALMPAARADMGRPTWTVGDYWRYSFTGEQMGLPGTGSMRLEVVGTESVVVGGATYSSYRAELAINMTSDSLTFNIPGEMWFRTSDLAFVKATMTMTVSVPPMSFTMTLTMTYNPPQELHWPFSMGSTWSVTSLLTTVVEMTGVPPETESGTEVSNYTVLAEQDVTVPAGTFATIPVRANTTSTILGTSMAVSTVTYWSSEVGSYVREQTFDDLGQELTDAELAAYNYQNPPGAAGILGLPVYAWPIIAVVIVAAIVAAVVLRRKRPPVPEMIPQAPPAAPPPPPPGPPPPLAPP